MALKKKLLSAFILIGLIASVAYAADKKISDLTLLTGASYAVGDLIPIVDISASQTKKTTIGNLDLRYQGVGNYLVNPLTNNGDIITMSGDVETVLAIGATYGVLQSNGSTFSWETTLAGLTLTSPNVNGANLNFGTASNTNRLLLAKDTTSNLDALTDVQALLAYDTTQDKPVYNAGAGWLPIGGGGGGGISNAEYNFLIASEVNTSFEDNVDDWTGSTTAPTQETTDEIEGEGSLSWDPAGAETLRSSAVPIPAWAYGTNCYAEIYYSLGDTEYSLKVLDGTNTEITSSGGVTASTNAFAALSGESAIAYRTFVCPSSGSVKLSLETSGAADEIIIDRAYIGSNFRLSEVNQAVLAGESYFAATTNCAWVVTSTSASAFPTDTDCPGPTIVRSQLGSWQTTDSNLPIQTINNLPAGTYKATFIFLSVSSASTGARYHINDGTTTSIGSPGYNDTNSAASTVTATFEYSSAGNRAFQLYGSSVSGSVTAFASVAPINFILEKFPSEGELAYTPPPTTELTNVFSAQVANDGTVTNENVDFISGNCTNAAPRVCTFVSGIFNGVTPNCTFSEARTVSASATSASFSQNGFTSWVMCQRGEGDYSVKQSSAPLLVNSVVSDYAGVIAVGAASLTESSGTYTVSSQSGNWIASVADTAAGVQTLTLTSGFFSATPWFCACGSTGNVRHCDANPSTATTVVARVYNDTALSDNSFSIYCIGPK